MAELSFSKKTFTYFDGARKHARDRDWFDAHRALYEDYVELPFTHLIALLKDRLSPHLPGIVFSPRKLAKPLLRRAKDDEDGPVLRQNAFATFTEPATSMFEMNPGIYISIGANEDDNVCGCGIYMPSSRQIKELRTRFYTEYVDVRRVLESKPIRTHWGGLAGDKYKRFPKEYDEHAPGAEYLWHKQFFLSKHLSRTEIIDPGFAAALAESLAVAVPFLTWTRNAVGVYRKPPGGYKQEFD